MTYLKRTFLFPMLLIALMTGCIEDPEGTTYTGPDTGDLDAGADTAQGDTAVDPDDDATTTPDTGDTDDPDAGPPPTCSDTVACPERAGSDSECIDDSCVYTCQEGFVNLDGSAATGCECQITDANDVPNGEDTNCDGVDGIAEHNVYVAGADNQNGRAGDDDADGTTPTTPFATLGKAIEFAAATEGRTTILVMAGEYHENVTLQSGVHLIGGYNGDWSLTDGMSVLIADANEADKTIATLTAADIDAETVVKNFEIRGPDHSATPGASTYAVRVTDSPGETVRFVNSQIVAGKAGAGENGVDGEAALTSSDGGNAASTAAGAAGASACGSTGGSGGNATTCASTTGEDGSRGQALPVSTRREGHGGSGAVNRCNSTAIACSPNDNETDGEAGHTGGNGAHGDGGVAASAALGAFVEGIWSADASAIAAAAGENGTGGGGGGAGRSDFCDVITNNNPTGDGGGGGGGGGGGCAGSPGTNGTPGGSAFAMVLIDSQVSFIDTELLLGAAGDGGDGGAGSPGTEGAHGGFGQARSNTRLGSGGHGGHGGNGGHGGGGAGGCGGSSIGIALVGDSSVPSSVTYTSGAAAVAGTGGTGGSSDGNAGQDGCNGVTQDAVTY